MAETAEVLAEIAHQGAHVGTAAAHHLERNMVGIGPLDQVEAVDLDEARRQIDRFAAPRQIVGALAFDLDCGEAGRHLLDPTDETRQRRFDLGGVGRSSLRAITSPSASSVVRASPRRTVKR